MIDGTEEGHRAAVEGGPLDPAINGYAEETYTTPARRRHAAALPAAERQSLVARMLVRTPTFKATIDAVRGFHMPVTGGHAQTAMIAGIVGDTRTGKSWALKHYQGSLGMKPVENAKVPRALYFNCDEGITSTLLAAKVRKQLGLRRARGSAVDVFDHAVHTMKTLGIELLILDDAQFAIASPNDRTRKEVIAFIKNVYEEQAGCVILAGDGTVDTAVWANPMVEGRGGWPKHRVHPYEWSYDDDDPGEFRETLDEVADRLPFEETPDLGEVTVAAHLYKLSGGRIGAAMNYVRAAAYAAIEDRSKTLTTGHLRAVAAMRRRVGDPYEAFRSSIDATDPTGARHRADTAATVESNAGTSLSKKDKRRSAGRSRPA